MIIDSSVLIAILKREPDYSSLSAALDASTDSRMSAASYLETGIVADAWRDPILSRQVDELVEQFSIEIEPVTVEQALIAREAYRDYGRASGHPANLNFSDCFSYALARAKREPILFKGDNFRHTDLRSVTETK